MFVNFSNHPKDSWGDSQKAAAMRWGEIADVPFPPVPADADETVITKMADEAVENILRCHPDAVMCQGEFTLAFAVISRLREKRILTVAACAERVVEERLVNGKYEKRVMFEFVRFREYQV